MDSPAGWPQGCLAWLSRWGPRPGDMDNGMTYAPKLEPKHGPSSAILSGFYDVYPLVNVYITMENHHFHWELLLFLWPCSIAMLNYQRVREYFVGCNQMYHMGMDHDRLQIKAMKIMGNHGTCHWAPAKSWKTTACFVVDHGKSLCRMGKSWNIICLFQSQISVPNQPNIILRETLKYPQVIVLSL